MSNNNDNYLMADEEFRVGLYSYSIPKGLRFVSSVNLTDRYPVYVTPNMMRNILNKPEDYIDQHSEVFIWLQEPLIY